MEVDALVIEAVRTSTRTAARSVDGGATAPPGTVTGGPAPAEALARRDAISLEFPDRPTWIGDRWRANTLRIYRAYGLDMSVVWPRLWSVLPETLRADLATAQSAYTNAGTLVGWAALYGALGIWWWPALLIGGAALTAGALRSRTATATLCLLVETAADLHSHTLAEQLHMPCPGPVTPVLGNDISASLRKDPDPARRP
jgi:hypothetical protein